MSNKADGKMCIIKPGLANNERAKVSYFMKSVHGTKIGTTYEIPAKAETSTIAEFITTRDDTKAELKDAKLVTILKQDIAFLLILFQKNAAHLAITSNEKNKVKDIVRRVQE